MVGVFVEQDIICREVKEAVNNQGNGPVDNMPLRFYVCIADPVRYVFVGRGHPILELLRGIHVMHEKELILTLQRHGILGECVT